MRKILSLVLALALVLTMGSFAFAEGEMTDVGTPRAETLIVECQSPTDVPGQFNTYMSGTQAGFGIHQLMSVLLWEIDSVAGEQFGEVAEGMPESNEDFTEHTVKIRQGIKWSDGEDLTAKDVAFTFNMILENSAIGVSAYANTVFESVEATDDYTVVFKTKESFPRLALKFGATIWGTDYRIVPEHIYSQVEDVTTFRDENPVVAGPYTVKDYDPNGNWILYELREDWQDSVIGVVKGYTEAPAAKYVWFRYLGDDTTRQMAMVNNEVDILCEVTPEIYDYMSSQNENIKCWYDEFPYATTEDPGAKGIVFSMGKGEPYNNADFRWGCVLAMDFENISLSIFDGVGKASAFPILEATAAGTEYYYKPLLEWVENFELDLGDGTTIKPWDGDYATRIAEYLGVEGTEDELKEMFGLGWWKHDEEAAEKLFIKAGLEKRDDGWYFNGEKFTIEFSYLADTEAQAGRGLQAAYQELMDFGFDCTLISKSSSTWDTDGTTGNYEIAGYWPTGTITKDIYSQVSAWNCHLNTPLGETTSGQGFRWEGEYAEQAAELIEKYATLDPESDEAYETALELVKVSIIDMPVVTFHTGTKFVPTNSTYWTNYPSSTNAYNGPWWWWSCFKYIVPEIQPAA